MWETDEIILQSCQLFAQEVNDHSAEHKAGEDGEQTSDTWTQNKQYMLLLWTVKNCDQS